MSSNIISHDVISHVKDTEEPEECCNIKSRKEPKKKCRNNATHGKFCGIHYKRPQPWNPPTPELAATPIKNTKKQAPVKKKPIIDKSVKASQIQKWFRLFYGLNSVSQKGPAFFIRSLCTNDTDFFSTDLLTDISGYMFFSYKDPDNHIYGFDIRSINQLIARSKQSGETALNPFTRSEIPTAVIRRVLARVRWNNSRHLPIEWAPLTPPTPEQQQRMKIVDLFHRIDELNYYSSPNWFIELDQRGQRRFYNELNAIWTHRAGLSMVQKNTIVPNFSQKLFRYAPWALIDQSLESIQKINMGIIRTMISSAADRNDCILGAMYVVSALTLVSRAAREAYPWLYESVAGSLEDDAEEIGGLLARADIFPPLAPGPAAEGGQRRNLVITNLLGIGWLNNLLAYPLHRLPPSPIQVPAPLALDAPPPLQLPPPSHSSDSEE